MALINARRQPSELPSGDRARHASPPPPRRPLDSDPLGSELVARGRHRPQQRCGGPRTHARPAEPLETRLPSEQVARSSQRVQVTPRAEREKAGDAKGRSPGARQGARWLGPSRAANCGPPAATRSGTSRGTIPCPLCPAPTSAWTLPRPQTGPGGGHGRAFEAGMKPTEFMFLSP